MKAGDRSCLACGARQDEHDGPIGPCRKIKCKGFSDPYDAFNESWEPIAPPSREEAAPVIPAGPQVSPDWRDWISAHPLYTAAAILILVIAAVILRLVT